MAIMQGGRQDLRLSLPLPKIENPNAKQPRPKPAGTNYIQLNDICFILTLAECKLLPSGWKQSLAMDMKN